MTTELAPAAPAPEVIWTPHPGPQTEFLKAGEDEVLYGGAAGGGKSDALIVDILGLFNWWDEETQTWRHCIEHPNYRGIIFRKYSTDLSEVIDRAQELYTQIDPGVRWFEVKKRFVFSSGARIEMGHVTEDGDELRYKSRQFQYVGWEELTEHPTISAYEYLKSRTRSAHGLPKLTRATTNPDGPGHTWVKEYFRIQDNGHDVPTFEIEVEVDGEKKIFTRRFIRALVSQNPTMDPDYKFRLADMSEDKRRALLEGRWDILNIEGVIYKKQIERIVKENRVVDLPYLDGYPVNTFWDLGANDAMAIWFHQRVGGKDRFIDYLEDRQQALEHYARALQDRGYLYGMHYLPHDATHRRLGSANNDTIQEMLEDLGIQPTEVIDRVPALADGLELGRRALSSCWFDKEKTKRGVDALKNYRFRFDKRLGTTTQTPLHNWASNGADAFRQFAQAYQTFGLNTARTDLDEPSPTPVINSAYKRREAPPKRNNAWRH